MPKTILVMDDEEGVRALLEDFLLNSGYAVLLAEDGAQALDALRELGERVDLILLDGSPDVSRRKTLMEIRALCPNIPVVVMSGKSWEDLKPQFEGLPVAGYLEKPSSLGRLLQVVQTSYN